MQIIEQQPTFLGEPWTPGLPTTFLSGVFCTPGGMAWPWLGGRPWARYCCCRARNCCSSSATTSTSLPGPGPVLLPSTDMGRAITSV